MGDQYQGQGLKLAVSDRVKALPTVSVILTWFAQVAKVYSRGDGSSKKYGSER